MDFNTITGQVSLYINTFGCILMFLLMLRKVILEKKATGSINTVKFLILMAFLLEVYSILLEDWFYTWGIFPPSWQVPSDTLGVNTLGKGGIVTVGLCMTFYILGWKPFKLMPVYLYLGMIIYFFLTGIDVFYFWYVIIGGIIGVTVMIAVGSKLKDNGAIGLGILYLIAFVGVVFGMIPEIMYIGPIRIAPFFFISQYTFGVYFSLGYFKPYKDPTSQRSEEAPEDQDVVLQLAEVPSDD